MLNTVYRLISPRRIEAEFNDIDLDSGNVIVRPTHLSICHADQRYYQGSRPPEVLKKKLPMALIHEAIGTVVYDPLCEFPPGQPVILIPNTPVEEDKIIAENYLLTSKFRASGYDGFMQDVVSQRRDRLIILPDWIEKNVAVFTELVSVSMHAINRFDQKAHGRRDSIGIWGDGNLAYITSLLLKKRFPDCRIIVFGKNGYKLEDFVFTDENILISDIPKELTVDHAFECVGRQGSEKAVDQIIDHIKPEGTISLLGVSEDPIAINTRMVLEKGLVLYGSSRSGKQDFEDTIALYEKHPEIVDLLDRLVTTVINVETIDDMNLAFTEDLRNHHGKTVMK